MPPHSHLSSETALVNLPETLGAAPTVGVAAFGSRGMRGSFAKSRCDVAACLKSMACVMRRHALLLAYEEQRAVEP